MVLGLYISNSGIRAAHLDQDGLPVHLTISNSTQKFIVDPAIFINEEFAHTGEHIDKLLFTQPNLKFHNDILIHLEKEFQKIEQVSWTGKSLFTIILKYVLFKCSSSVSENFDRVIVSCPAEWAQDDYLAISEAIRMNGASYVTGISQEEAICHDLIFRKIFEDGDTALAMYIDENKASISLLKYQDENFSKVKTQTFDLLNNYRLKITKQLKSDFRNEEWPPSHMDRNRLENVAKEVIVHCLVAEEKFYRKNIILDNQAVSIQYDERWISKISQQLTNQLSTRIEQYLESHKMAKGHIQKIIVHGPFSSMPILQKVFGDINDQLKDNIFIDPDGTIALNGLLKLSRRIERAQDIDSNLIEMPVFIKNVTVNNLIV